jgi:large subunit ribosomal protein L18
MKNIKSKNIRRERRATRVRSKVFGTQEKPRLSVFKSNRNIYVQAIDDVNGKTLFCVSCLNKDKKTKLSPDKVGAEIAKMALEKKISKAVLDRGSYKYHGNIKSIVESARKGGLKI